MTAIVTKKSLYIKLDGKNKRIDLKDPMYAYFKMIKALEEQMRQELGIRAHLAGK